MNRYLKYAIILLALIFAFMLGRPSPENKLYEFEIWLPSEDVVIVKDREDYFVSDFLHKASKRITDPKRLAEVKRVAEFKKIRTSLEDAIQTTEIYAYLAPEHKQAAAAKLAAAIEDESIA